MTRNILDRHLTPSRPRAVIYIPAADRTAAADRCMAHVREHRYHFVGLVVDDWEAVRQMIKSGEVGVVVADQRDDVPCDRIPRFEFVAEQPVARPEQRVYRRTRVIRPGAAG